jgi:hypothetical protein
MDALLTSVAAPAYGQDQEGEHELQRHPMLWLGGSWNEQ